VAYSSTAAAEPLSCSEALRRPDAEQWKQAALEELNAHSTNGTWELVPRPKGKKIFGSKWVFKFKRNADGSVEYKGRLVAKGYNQRSGFDYLEIFAPTVRMPTIRVVLAMAAIQELHLRSIDISHAYLNGEMDCDVYMEQPEGFAVGDPRERWFAFDQTLPTLLAILQDSTLTLVWLIGKLSSTSFAISRAQLTMALPMHLIPILMNCSQPSQMRIMVDAKTLDVLQVATWSRLVLVLSPGLRSCKALLPCLQLKQSTLQPSQQARTSDG